MELLEYNPESGIFTWRGTNRRGRVAGCRASDGYVKIAVDRRQYLAHCLAWLYVHGKWPHYVEHINGIRHDDRIANLRNVEGKIKNGIRFWGTIR
jgi:hypothetical protein